MVVNASTTRTKTQQKKRLSFRTAVFVTSLRYAVVDLEAELNAVPDCPCIIRVFVVSAGINNRSYTPPEVSCQIGSHPQHSIEVPVDLVVDYAVNSVPMPCYLNY